MLDEVISVATSIIFKRNFTTNFFVWEIFFAKNLTKWILNNFLSSWKMSRFNRVLSFSWFQFLLLNSQLKHLEKGFVSFCWELSSFNIFFTRFYDDFQDYWALNEPQNLRVFRFLDLISVKCVTWKQKNLSRNRKSLWSNFESKTS